jgi:cell wall assembly regulator SMI1/ankyrin repeat protein
VSKAPAWENECIFAVVNGDASAMRRAIGLGLPVNGLVFGDKTHTPLHYAVNNGAKPSVVAVLLEAGADVNATVGDPPRSLAETPIMMAAYEGRLDLVRQLLGAGADVNARTPSGVTALECAGWGGKTSAHAKVMREQIAAGAKPAAESLTAAARRGSPEMVRLLIDAGANVHEISRWGTTLHLAVDENRADTVTALLEAGADPAFRLPADAKEYGGTTALELARKKKLKKILALLEAPPADRPAPRESIPEAPPDVGTVWKRLEAALKAAAPEVKKSLNRPATQAQIEKLEARLGVKFPDEVRASYLRHDGQRDGQDGLLPEGFAELDEEFRLLPLAEILSEWEPWKELLDIGEFAGNTATPDDGVRADWWNPCWVPIASNGGGDSLCIDLAPDEGGTLGQVMLMSHEGGGRPRLARSFGHLLADLADHYEQGAEAE